jgi:hypothetical protein
VQQRRVLGGGAPIWVPVLFLIGPSLYWGCAKTTKIIVSSVVSGEGVRIAGPPGTFGTNTFTVPTLGILDSSEGDGPCTLSRTAFSDFASALAAVSVGGEALEN